jgi:signal transduction histidine kinase
VGEVYRVVQEGLSNVYRHAEARAVRVRLAYREREMELTIADDGCGFDPNAERTRGRGIANMQERALRLGGRLVVEAAPGRGTMLIAVIPNEERADVADPRPTR